MTSFDEVAASYRRLRGLHQDGQLTAEEFAAAAARLGLVDESGVPWVIGVESGDWYRFTAGEWLRIDPSTQFSDPLPPPPPESAATPTPEPANAPQPVATSRPGWGTVGLSVACILVAGLLAAAAFRGGDPTSGPSPNSSSTQPTAAESPAEAAPTTLSGTTSVEATVAPSTTGTSAPDVPVTTSVPAQPLDPASKSGVPVVWRAVVDVRLRDADDASLLFEDTSSFSAIGAAPDGIEGTSLTTDTFAVSRSIASEGQIIEVVASLPEPYSSFLIACRTDEAGIGGYIIRFSNLGWSVLADAASETLGSGDALSHTTDGEITFFRVMCTDETIEVMDDRGVLYRDRPSGGTGAGTQSMLWLLNTAPEDVDPAPIIIFQHRIYAADVAATHGSIGDRVFAGGVGVEVTEVHWVEEADDATLGISIDLYAVPDAFTPESVWFRLDTEVALQGQGTFPFDTEIPADHVGYGEIWFPAGSLTPGDRVDLTITPPWDAVQPIVFQITVPTA